jgi:hypothetical protein
MDGRRQPARIQVSVGEVAEPALDPGCRRLDFPFLGEDDEPGRVRPLGIAGLADQQPRARTGRKIGSDRLQKGFSSLSNIGSPGAR